MRANGIVKSQAVEQLDILPFNEDRGAILQTLVGKIDVRDRDRSSEGPLPAVSFSHQRHGAWPQATRKATPFQGPGALLR